MTQSAIVAKYSTESYSVQSLLIGIALILCMAKAAKNASSFLRKKVVFVQDEHVSQRRANLVFFVDTPINQRTSSLVDDKSPVDDLAYESFCQENREYVKNWKKEGVHYQLIKMWQELGAQGQKEWINKAEDLRKLFGCKNLVDQHSHGDFGDIEQQLEEITGSCSAEGWFNSEIRKFEVFCKKEHPERDISTWKRILSEWIQLQCGDDSHKTTRYNVLHALKFDEKIGFLEGWKQLDWKLTILWSDDYESMVDSMVCAYNLFCQKVKRTDPEMSIDIDRDLSRMWELLK